MKIFQLICLLVLIIFTFQKDCDDYEKKEECKTENLSTDDKNDGKEYCCFYKNGDYSGCTSLTKYQYKHMKNLVKYYKIKGYREDATIDCKSFYLEISILIVLFILI